MQLEIIDWLTIVKKIAQATGSTIKDVSLSVGLGGQVKPPAEPKYSEGAAILNLFWQHVGGEIPTLKRDENAMCPSCCKRIKSVDLIRVKASVFKCLDCINKQTK